jgi:hypothetical protein
MPLELVGSTTKLRNDGGLEFLIPHLQAQKRLSGQLWDGNIQGA